MAERTVAPDPLDQLASQAELEQTDPTGSPGEPGQAEPAGITNAQAFAGAMAAGREAFCFFTKLESPRRVLNDDRIGQLSGLADPVLTKHGINLGAYLGDFGPEIALAVATFALVAELRTAVNAEIQAKMENASKSAPSPIDVENTSVDGQ